MFFYDINNFTNRLEIFSPTGEVGAITSLNTSTWSAFETGFGIGFDVFPSPGNQAYTWFTDSSLNQVADGTPVDTAFQHVDWINPVPGTFVFGLEDLPSQWADNDPSPFGVANNDFVVSLSGCGLTETAPVPEPATMLLFGTGLVGLAGARRRKAKKKIQG